MLAVATAPYGLIVIRMDEATLSQRLHTPPLPVTHALVGYRWQYIGLCPVQAGTTALQATSCRTFAYPPEKVYFGTLLSEQPREQFCKRLMFQ